MPVTSHSKRNTDIGEFLCDLGMGRIFFKETHKAPTIKEKSNKFTYMKTVPLVTRNTVKWKDKAQSGRTPTWQCISICNIRTLYSDTSKGKMGKRYEQAFHRRRNLKHEKMLNLISNQVNANQKHNEWPKNSNTKFHFNPPDWKPRCWWGYGKLPLWVYVGQVSGETIWHYLTNLKMYRPYNSLIPLLETDLKD